MEQSVESGKDIHAVKEATSEAPAVTAVETPVESVAAPEAAAQPIRLSARDRLAAMMAPLAARPRLSRAAVLALAIAVAAAAGSAVGAVAAVALSKPQAASAAEEAAHTVEVNALKGIITQLSSEVASLKSSVEKNAKTANAQIAKVAERVEKAQAEPAARVQKLSEMIERLDRKTEAAAASSDLTGSINTHVSAPLPVAAPKHQDRVVDGWLVRGVFRGKAMLENERLGFYEAVPGADLPGVGRVQTIRRQDGRWVVVTPKGLIVSSR